MPLFGKDATTYLSSALLDGDSVTVDSATWEEVENIADETDNFSAEEVDITTRATAKLGWNATAFTTKNAEVSFTMMMELSDPLVTALMDAFENTTPVALMFLSGPEDSAGSFGLAGNWSISLTFPKPVKGVQTADVTAKIYSHAAFVSVEGS